MSLSSYSLILKNDGTLWECGTNNYGQLGLGDTNNRTTFTQVTTNADDIKEIHCGEDHTFILENDGTLWGCGYNAYGQLDLGDTSNRYTFTQITTNADDIKSVYCGMYHTLILKNDGTLWGAGYNYHGQLGLGDTNSRTTFTQITTNTSDIKSVYCGYNHTFILKNDGTLWSTGCNDRGQLGLGDTTNRTTFTQVTTNTNDIKEIYCGGLHTFMLKNDGTLWGTGVNSEGELGLGDGTNRYTFTQVTTNADDIKEIYCGGGHTFILKNDGTLWGIGYNLEGQLGLGNTNHRYTFTQITTNTDNIKSIYCGYLHTIVLKNDGTLWGCGYNGYGQLGLGDTSNRTTFTQITTNADDIKEVYCGWDHTLILKNDGTLWSCGRNEYGQLGLGDTNYRTTFTQITTNADNVKSLPNQYEDIPTIIKVYDLNTGLIETLDTNNFKNIPVDKFEKIKVLYTNPDETLINCLISFDNKATWKTFDGINWATVSDTTPNNILLSGMSLKAINSLDKVKLISGGFTGNMDFKIALKTNNKTKTPSITKIYIQYKS